MSDTTYRYLCERCGGSGKAIVGDAPRKFGVPDHADGRCGLCDGEGYLGTGEAVARWTLALDASQASMPGRVEAYIRDLSLTGFSDACIHLIALARIFDRFPTTVTMLDAEDRCRVLGIDLDRLVTAVKQMISDDGASVRNGWTGNRCPTCKGTGEDNDARACRACSGTGDEYVSRAPATPGGESRGREVGDAVEHSLRQWKDSHMNDDGDCVGLLDRISEEQLDDLIDSVSGTAQQVADRIIAAAEPRGREGAWTSVEERLPEPMAEDKTRNMTAWVWVYCGRIHEDFGRYRVGFYAHAERRWLLDGGGHETRNGVTHWMPPSPAPAQSAGKEGDDGK